jgi:hypothetical protein
MKRILVAIAAIAVAVLHVSTASAVQTKPPTTTSWYVYMTSDESDQTFRDWMYNTGYQAGQNDLALAGTQTSVAFLDFGQPWEVNGVKGTWSFSGTYGRFLNTTLILDGLKQYALGYYYGTGADTASTMKVIAGTNNYGSKTTYAHGQAWAQMVKDFGTWLAQNSAGSQVAARAGNDMEPDWSSATVTRAWVDGYASVWASPYHLYNYGAASGCPSSGTTSTAAPCNGGWTQADMRYVSWGAAPAWPFPEIYATSGVNAKQWQQISLYSYLANGSAMSILGPLSQKQACVQRGGCTGIDNTADAAWSQMWTQLNNDTRTAQSLTYSSDIKWRK